MKQNTNALGWRHSNFFIVHDGRRWFSTAKNWRKEYQDRMESGITDPFINPQTGTTYSINAANYRKHTIQTCIHTEEQIASGTNIKYVNF